MKIAVINFSGNVGKSTIANHLLKPRLNTEQIEVETHNSANSSAMRVSGDQYKFVQKHLLKNEVAIIDVGASNIGDFLEEMGKYQSSHEDIDLFLVPVVQEIKQQKDTIATIEALSALGVPAKKIRVVFNMMPANKSPEELFGAIYAYAEDQKKCVIKPGSVIHKNEIFEEIKSMGKTVSEVAADKTDYRAMIKTAKDDAESDHFIQMTAVQRLAVGVKEELDAVFKAVTK